MISFIATLLVTTQPGIKATAQTTHNTTCNTDTIWFGFYPNNSFAVGKYDILNDHLNGGVFPNIPDDDWENFLDFVVNADASRLYAIDTDGSITVYPIPQSDQIPGPLVDPIRKITVTYPITPHISRDARNAHNAGDPESSFAFLDVDYDGNLVTNIIDEQTGEITIWKVIGQQQLADDAVTAVTAKQLTPPLQNMTPVFPTGKSYLQGVAWLPDGSLLGYAQSDDAGQYHNFLVRYPRLDVESYDTPHHIGIPEFNGTVIYTNFIDTGERLVSPITSQDFAYIDKKDLVLDPTDPTQTIELTQHPRLNDDDNSIIGGLTWRGSGSSAGAWLHCADPEATPDTPVDPVNPGDSAGPADPAAGNPGDGETDATDPAAAANPTDPAVPVTPAAQSHELAHTGSSSPHLVLITLILTTLLGATLLIHKHTTHKPSSTQ